MENTCTQIPLPARPQRGILWLSLPEQEAPVPLRFATPARHFHVTLAFNCYFSEEFLERFVGETVRVRVEEECWNGRIQALRVTLPEGRRNLCENAHPHMTLSMCDGVRPVEANQMLASTHESAPVTLTEMDLVLEFCPFS